MHFAHARRCRLFHVFRGSHSKIAASSVPELSLSLSWSSVILAEITARGDGIGCATERLLFYFIISSGLTTTGFVLAVRCFRERPLGLAIGCGGGGGRIRGPLPCRGRRVSAPHTLFRPILHLHVHFFKKYTALEPNLDVSGEGGARVTPRGEGGLSLPL